MTEPGESASIDDGEAIHYLAVSPGTPVYSSDGVEVGSVTEMLDNSREHIFDGVVFRHRDGGLRFADAPEVARTAERGVTLLIGAEEADRLGPPEKASVPSQPRHTGGGGALGRLFGRKRD